MWVSRKLHNGLISIKWSIDIYPDTEGEWDMIKPTNHGGKLAYMFAGLIHPKKKRSYISNILQPSWGCHQ
jgi:hypothetical protein